MRYAIISDIHANIEALRAVLDKIELIGVDQVLCLGDVVGYNASPNECVDVIRERGIPTICGNHDAVACGLEEPWGFNPIALAAALWTRENLSEENLRWLKSLPDVRQFEYFLIVHGSPSNRNTYLFTWEDVLPHVSYLEERNCSLCFFGHTHSPGIFSSDGAYSLDEDMRFRLDRKRRFFINPGSAGQPRDSDPRASFGVVDTATDTYESVRVSYPLKLAAERIMQEGLPHFLAERLFLGR